MSSRTEIPAYNPEEFADAVDSTHRDTRVPAFDVGLLARAADVEVTDVTGLPFALTDVPLLGTMTGKEPIDHRAAFLLLNIDGRSSIETVIRLSHVPAAEAHVALLNMLAVGLITIRGQSANDDQTVKHPSGLWSRKAVDRAMAVNDGECWTFAVQ